MIACLSEQHPGSWMIRWICVMSVIRPAVPQSSSHMAAVKRSVIKSACFNIVGEVTMLFHLNKLNEQNHSTYIQ